MSVTYVTKGKRTGLPGNLLVSTCVVVPFIYGSFVVQEPRLSVLLFMVIGFLSITRREVAKGIVDVEGDKAQDISTIAVVHGARNAAISSSIFLILAVALTPLPWVLELVSSWYLPFVILTDAGLVWSCLSLLQDYSRENARGVKNLILLWLFLGLMAFISGTS